MTDLAATGGFVVVTTQSNYERRMDISQAKLKDIIKALNIHPKFEAKIEAQLESETIRSIYIYGTPPKSGKGE